ncbi:MAG: response regulator, partial [Proteobacteria bacterium]|nr:response regulator [Pseudomonadota bacterium]
RRKVLVVDDIDSNRSLAIDLLKPLGFELAQAQDGRQAIERAQSLAPDVILMDWRMPVMDGWQAAQQIRQIPVLQNTVIIGMSASVSDADRAQSRAAHIDAFVPKPIHWPRLAKLFARHLNLQWVYESVQQAPAADEALVAPPPDALAALYELARMGKMTRLKARARELERLDGRYSAFARRLIALVKRMEIKQIQALLKQHMEAEI